MARRAIVFPGERRDVDDVVARGVRVTWSMLCRAMTAVAAQGRNPIILRYNAPYKKQGYTQSICVIWGDRHSRRIAGRRLAIRL